MLTLGSLAFAAPWALSALVVLPALFWLSRVTPPNPRRVRFPAIELLRGLAPVDETPARTPWWLTAWRVFTAALIVVGLSAPLLNPRTAPSGDTGPIVLVVDNGWAAARDWPSRRAAMDDVIARAERAGRSLIILPAAAQPGTEGPVVGSVLSPVEARRVAQTLEPRPWPTDRPAVAAIVRDLAVPKPTLGVWISDGVDGPGALEMVRALQRLGSAEVTTEADGGRSLHLLFPPQGGGERPTARVRRVDPSRSETVTVRLTAGDGRLLARETLVFSGGEASRDVSFNVPNELRNEATAIRVEDEPTAGATVLLDERWRRRTVGLVVDKADGADDQPFLSAGHYLARALEPYNDLRRGRVPELTTREMSVILMPDLGPPSASDADALGRWIEAGGLLVRFAGPKMARDADDLVPARLRGGDRALGGAMSWADPARLSPFDADSPFAGLEVPDDVVVRRQVLCEPTPDLAERTWARLADGTPLVTWARRGDGRVVLVHTTAGPEWSTLAMSGLYVEMLRRLVALGSGAAGGSSQEAAEPRDTLDGWGRLGPAPTTARSIPPKVRVASAIVDATHPPGFYGREDQRVALNLTASTVLEAKPITAYPDGVTRRGLDDRPEVALGPRLLAAAMAAMSIDLVIALALRGLFRRRSAAVLGLVCALGLFSAIVDHPALAAFDDAEAGIITGETRLAYVVTGDEGTDAISRAGLIGLTDVLVRRTAVEAGPPQAVDVETDELSFFPLLYWPTTLVRRPPPSPGARARINTYLHDGGMILFDTRDQYGDGTSAEGVAALRAITRGVDMPQLAPIPAEHVLARSFYLLSGFPGRFSGAKLWVERGEGGVNDGVSPVVVGGNDWASAWAVDKRGLPLRAVIPGGEQQRELAYRFGINVVMYALTGNYKADQVHVPAILERLGR